MSFLLVSADARNTHSSIGGNLHTGIRFLDVEDSWVNQNQEP